MANVELATAYISLIPTMQGVQGKVAEALLPAGAEADKAGKSSGGMFAGGFSGALGAAAIGVVATGAAVAGAAVGLYKVGAVFDDVTDTIRVGTGASGEALDGLVDIAKEVGATVPTSFEAAGQTVSDLNQRLGLSGDTLSTVAQQYIQAGNILGTDVDISTTTAAFSAFGIEGANVEGAMDSLFKVAQATGVGMNELASTIQTNAVPMQNLGFSFEDTAALAGSLDKAGLNTSQTMASMGKSLVTLAKAGEEPQAAFKRTTAEIGEFIKSGDTAGALNLASKVFGTKGATAFVGALQSGKINLDDLTKSAGLTGDTILGLGQETADAAESWELVKNKALLALEPMGTAVFNFAGTQLGLLADNMDGIVANITNFATEAGKVISVLTTGDFTGPIFGLEEDSALVDFLFDIRDGVTTFGDAARNAGSFVQTDLVPGLLGFGQWLVDNQGTIANVATGITVLLLPALVRLGVTALVSGAQQVAAWAMSGAGAITTGATYIAQSYMIIARWVAMGAAAIISGAETVAIWTLYKLEAIKGAAAYALQSAQVAAAWVAMSAAAVASGIKTAAVWVGSVVASAVTGAISFGVQVATVVAGWVLMGVQATIEAAKQAAAWVVGVAVPAVAAGITMGVQAAIVVAGWVLMGVQAMANAVRMAAAWFIALGPIGWVTAAVIGLVALIIANWDSVVKFTTEAFTNIGNFLRDTWNNIVKWVSDAIENTRRTIVDVSSQISTAWNSFWAGFGAKVSEIWEGIKTGVSNGINAVVDFVKALPDKVLGFFSNAGSLLLGAGGNIIEGFLRGLTQGFEDVKNFVGGIGQWIADNKGPKAYDLALLVPAGGWIMDGLGGGIKAGIPALKRILDSVSATISTVVTDSSITSAVNGMVTVPSAPSYGAASASGDLRTAGGMGATYNIYETDDPIATAHAVARRQSALAS